jgi:para-nitrobenzyl esterase
MTVKYQLICFFYTLIVSASDTTAQKTNAITAKSVKTSNGFISGTFNTRKNVLIFKGVPYASPPIGDLRWKEPQPAQVWTTTFKADHFGPSAMQAKPIPSEPFTKEFLIPENGAISEDCLYLNVWTGAKNSDEKRPVIVFIHGGAFLSGSGSVPLYDGEAIATKGAVFVTINYRVGIFGFFAHPELTKESKHHASGNYGILDQIAALKWVHNNIGAFGGDPENVTIAGQSAGGMSVSVLAASPLARGLFSKMISESGAMIVKGTFGGTTLLDTAEIKGAEFAKRSGAADIKALRNIPAEKLQSMLTGFSGVIVDGFVLPEPITSAYAKGAYAALPLLTGYNHEDGFGLPNVNLEDYKDYIVELFGDEASKALKMYPAATNEEAAQSLQAISRDSFLGLQSYAWGRKQSETGKNNVFMYFFTRKIPGADGNTTYGAFHSGELPYAYGNLGLLKRSLKKEDFKLSDLMVSYWLNFAKTGNPNGYGLPKWPAFNMAKAEVMIFNKSSKGTKHPFKNSLEFFYDRASQ